MDWENVILVFFLFFVWTARALGRTMGIRLVDECICWEYGMYKFSVVDTVLDIFP